MKMIKDEDVAIFKIILMMMDIKVKGNFKLFSELNQVSFNSFLTFQGAIRRKYVHDDEEDEGD